MIDELTGHPYFVCNRSHWHGSQAAADECDRFDACPTEWLPLFQQRIEKQRD